MPTLLRSQALVAPVTGDPTGPVPVDPAEPPIPAGFTAAYPTGMTSPQSVFRTRLPAEAGRTRDPNSDQRVYALVQALKATSVNPANQGLNGRARYTGTDDASTASTLISPNGGRGYGVTNGAGTVLANLPMNARRVRANAVAQNKTNWQATLDQALVPLPNLSAVGGAFGSGGHDSDMSVMQFNLDTGKWELQEHWRWGPAVSTTLTAAVTTATRSLRLADPVTKGNLFFPDGTALACNASSTTKNADNSWTTGVQSTSSVPAAWPAGTAVRTRPAGYNFGDTQGAITTDMLASSGIFPDQKVTPTWSYYQAGWGVSASGFSQHAMRFMQFDHPTITPDDQVWLDTYGHALGIQHWQCGAPGGDYGMPDQDPSSRWPATRFDSIPAARTSGAPDVNEQRAENDYCLIPQGTRYVLPADFDCAAWASAHNGDVGVDWLGQSDSYVTQKCNEALVRRVCLAFREYGGFVHDTSGTTMITSYSSAMHGTPYAPAEWTGLPTVGKLSYYMPWPFMYALAPAHAPDKLGAQLPGTIA